MRYVFHILDATGHTTKEFGTDEKAASTAFAELLGKGHFAYEDKGGGEQRLLKGFDDKVEETTFHNQLAGG